jgi:transport family protein 27
VKQVPIPDTNIVVELFIYDCAGQSIFNQLEMISKYYENASAVMSMYSIASRDSLHATSKWIAAVKAVQNSGVALIGAFVGNKCEFRDGSIDSRAEVGMQEGRESAEVQGMAYFETSAANNINVEEPFQYIAHEFYKRSIPSHSIVYIVYMTLHDSAPHLPTQFYS